MFEFGYVGRKLTDLFPKWLVSRNYSSIPACTGRIKVAMVRLGLREVRELFSFCKLKKVFEVLYGVKSTTRW